MTTTDAESLLDLHRQLCAAVRSADQTFARFYVAAPDSELARELESGYRAALARTRAALAALEVDCRLAVEVSRGAPDEAFAATLEGARRVC